MANTTNYNWETPDDTDLVKDGAAAIRTLGSSIDTTTKNLNPETTTGDLAYRSATANVKTRLPLGTAGQVLRVNSGATAPEWATTADQTPLTTKGDLFGFDTADARIPIGTNGHVLTADSAQTLGLKWAAPAGGGKVLQVVNATYSTVTSTTSTSFVDTDLTASIAPTLSNSKILVLVSQVIYIENNNTTNDVWAGFKLVRGASDIFETTNAPALYQPSGTGLQIGALMSLAYYDNPATTSSTTYKTQFRVRANSLTARAQAGNTPSSITLLEIGA